jgi:formate hydrogenlyase subunit 3/multisubunit Na+/H+ antiporter MnhD subunit
MFLAPIVLFQAFKNQDHAFYIPVLIVGFLLALIAIGLGFYSIRIFIDALFGKKTRKSD